MPRWTIAEGRPVADHRSASDTGDEQVSIDARTSPALRSGVYFIGIGQFSTGVSTRATLVAKLVRTSPFHESPRLRKESAGPDINRLQPKQGLPLALPMARDAKQVAVQKGMGASDEATISKKPSRRLTLKQD